MWLKVKKTGLLIFSYIIFVEGGPGALAEAMLEGLGRGFDARDEAGVARRVVRYLRGAHPGDQQKKPTLDRRSSAVAIPRINLIYRSALCPRRRNWRCTRCPGICCGLN